MTRDTHAHAAGAIPPTSAEAPTAGTDRGPEDQHTRADSGTAADPCKAFATLRARLALAGYSLNRSDVADGPRAFYVGRWGMVRELPDLAAVCTFADQARAHRG